MMNDYILLGVIVIAIHIEWRDRMSRSSCFIIFDTNCLFYVRLQASGPCA